MNAVVSSANKKALESGRLIVGFLLAGYPDKESFFEVVSRCDKAGMDIFEIGVPSRNPYADGYVIRDAHLKVDTAVCTDMDYWRRLRKTTGKPIWIMGYRKDIIDTGVYLTLAKEGLADAMVLPDCSPGERHELLLKLAEYSVDVLGFVNPDMVDSELEDCYNNFPLIYTQLHTGPTGLAVESDDYLRLPARIGQEKLKMSFGGFGISTPEMAKLLLDHGFAGVVVGTAMIRKLNSSSNELYDFVRKLKKAAGKAGESR